MAGENGGDCGVSALTALLQAAHKGTTWSRLRYINVCVKERKTEREKQMIQMVRQTKVKRSQREEGT